jgi:prepilin-type N-terminal cleavage/methylation domain-containing protein
MKSTRVAAFSLVEVMCALAVLAIALVGFTQAISSALSSSKESELQTTAAWVAAGLIETLRADGIYTDGESEGEGSGAYAIYRFKQKVSSTSIDGLHEVVVEVANKNTGQQIYELRTMLFDPPSTTATNSNSNRRGGSGSSNRGGQR